MKGSLRSRMEWATPWTVHWMNYLMGFTMESWLYRSIKLLDTLLDRRLLLGFLSEIWNAMPYTSQLDDRVQLDLSTVKQHRWQFSETHTQ